MIVFILIALLLYAITAVLLFHSLSSFSKKERVIAILLGFGVVLVLTTLICFISAGKVMFEDQRAIGIARNASIILFSPIHSIIILPLLASSINGYKEKRIIKSTFQKRMLVLLGIEILVVIFGIGYIQNFDLGLLESIKK